MSKNLRANIELGAQIVIAIAVIVVAGVFVKRTLFPQRTNPARLPRINAGEQLNVPSVDWKQNQKTLVFFLMKDCKFCEKSAPFYRELLAEAAKRQVKSVAILPNSLDEAKEYVKRLELPIDNIQTGSLDAYKIPGTPSVLFVDSNGIVKKVWIGAPPGQDKQMRDELLPLFNNEAP